MSEEYNSIREEMLKRFETADQLVFFSIVSLGAIYSWLATQVFNTLFVFDDPFFFVIIGLVIISYTFSKYLHIHKRIYNQGSYLVAYHEISSKNDGKLKLMNKKWHILSRVYSEIFDKKINRFVWGWSGKANAIFLFFLGLAVWLGPIYLMIEKINVCVNSTQIVTVIISTIISVFTFVRIIVPLWCLKDHMYKNMSKWISLKGKTGETLDLELTQEFKAILVKEEKLLSDKIKSLSPDEKIKNNTPANKTLEE